MRFGLVILLFYICSFSVLGQSCCSGGVPVSSNLGFENAIAKTLQLSVSVDINILKSLYAEDQLLNDNDRKRTTQSYLIRGAYSIRNDLTIEAFLPFVRQTRKIYGVAGATSEATNGIGDPVILLTYEILKNPISATLGIGTQIPLGGFNHRNSRGLILVEDLQPGSGAFDMVFFSSIRFPLGIRPTTNGYLNFIYNSNGVNSESRGGLQTYQFGNDIQIISGISDQMLMFNQIVTPGIGVRYRGVQRDKIDMFDGSGTGGKFLFLRMSNGVALNTTSTINVNVELPILVRVNETQLAPTINFNIGFYKKFQKTQTYDILEN